MSNECAIRPRRMTRHDHLVGVIMCDIRKEPGPVPVRNLDLARRHAADRVADCYRNAVPGR